MFSLCAVMPVLDKVEINEMGVKGGKKLAVGI